MATDENRLALHANRERVDRAAGAWRQGDVFRFDQLAPLVVANLDVPLTPESVAAAAQAPEDEDRISVVWHNEEEFALVSQDCDIVGPSAYEPYVSVCPIVAVPAEQAPSAARGWMPGLAPIPALGPERCADLSRVVTLEKAVLLDATRVARLRDDGEVRLFRGVVHRHFSRAAFPDELQPALRPILDRLREKRGRQSAEGNAADAIHDIRIKGHPSWDAVTVSIDVNVYLLCFRDNYAAIAQEDGGQDADELWAEHRERWSQFLPTDATGRISSIELSIELYEELSAADYFDSDPLDLGGMSPQPV